LGDFIIDPLIADLFIAANGSINLALDGDR
jgi:hypothetical protein